MLRIAARRALDDGDLALADALVGQYRSAAEETGDMEDVLQRSTSPPFSLGRRATWTARDGSSSRYERQAVEDAKAALGEDAVAAAWARGEAMTPEEVVLFACSPVLALSAAGVRSKTVEPISQGPMVERCQSAVERGRQAWQRSRQPASPSGG